MRASPLDAPPWLMCALPACALAACLATPARAQDSTSVALPVLGGYVQARETVADGTGLTATLQRARVSVLGKLPRRFSYQLMVELEAKAGARSASSPSLREGFVRWSTGAVAVTAGQAKTPFSREFLVPSADLETADFAAVVDSLAPQYDLGVMAEARPREGLDLALGVFNGEGLNASSNRDSTVLGVGRVVLTPVSPVQLGAELALDSGDSLRWGLDANLERGPATLRGEYARRHVEGQAAGRADRGWYVLALWRVRPTVRLQARQEDFERPAYGVAHRVRGTTVGVNLDLVPGHVRLLLDGSSRASGAAQRHAHRLVAQLQARF